jgi:hypothetical protein
MRPEHIPDQRDLIWNTPWKYLIILDACRYDTFEEVNDIPGDLKALWSPGSRTPVWAEEIIDKATDQFKDVILVSSSQFLARRHSKFFHVHNCLLHNWNEEFWTVLPQDVNEVFLSLHRKYPEKRFMIWYMQPHVPFLGKRRITTRELGLRKNGFISIERIIKIHNFPLEYVIEAYKDNLRYVLGFVKEILPVLNGFTVLTSDHGNGFGEDGIFGHETTIEKPCLRLVPWLEIKR